MFSRAQDEIMQAINRGNIDLVRLLIQSVDVNKLYRSQFSLLNRAVIKQNIDIVKLLIDNGADVNLQGRFRNSVLLEAVKRQNIDIVKLLIDNRADINFQNKKGKTALLESVSFFNFSQVRDINVINIDIVKLLIDNGADINLQNKQGSSVLLNLLSVINIVKYSNIITVNYVEIIKYLVEHGADVNLQNTKGNSTLLEAIKLGDLEIVKYLLKSGYNMGAQDESNISTFHIDKFIKYRDVICYAAKELQLDIAAYFISNIKDAFVNNSNSFVDSLIKELTNSLVLIKKDTKIQNINNIKLLLCKEFFNHFINDDIESGIQQEVKELCFRVIKLESFIDNLAVKLEEITSDDIVSFSHFLSLYNFVTQYSYYNFYIDRVFNQKYQSTAHEVNQKIQKNLLLLLSVNKTGLDLPEDISSYINSFIINEFTHGEEMLLLKENQFLVEKMMISLNYNFNEL